MTMEDDNGFKLSLNFLYPQDVLRIEGSWVEIHFYTKNNKLIKIQKLTHLIM